VWRESFLGSNGLYLDFDQKLERGSNMWFMGFRESKGLGSTPNSIPVLHQARIFLQILSK
jgi:hypothetical protein